MYSPLTPVYIGSDFKPLNDFLADSILLENNSVPFNLFDTTANLTFVFSEVESTLLNFKEVCFLSITHFKTRVYNNIQGLNM